jgi:hypothetical protein
MNKTPLPKIIVRKIGRNSMNLSSENVGGARQASLGGEGLSKPGTSFTKQTGDMVYTMAENSWLSQLWLGA